MKDYFMMITNSWKRSILFACLFLFCVSGSLSARPVEYYGETFTSTRHSAYADYRDPRSFWSNWFVGAGGGGRILFADHAKQADLKDRISFGGEGYIGKWWSPFIGTRVGYSWQTLKGLTQEFSVANPYAGPWSTGMMYKPGPGWDAAAQLAAYRADPVKYGEQVIVGGPNGEFLPGEFFSKHHLWHQQFNAQHFYADCLFNITNLIGGVKDKRFWSVSPYAGVGWAMILDTPIGDWEKDNGEVSANIGVLNSFRLAKMIDLTLDVRGTMVNDRFHGQGNQTTRGRFQDGILSASLGLTVHLGKRDWASPTTGMSDAELAAMNERISELNRDNAALRRDLNTALSSSERLIEWRNIATDVYIRFQINETVLLKEARVQLGFLARLLREYPEGTYTITGYADAATGNPTLNMRLSVGRAEAVKNCLVNEFGIDPSRLTTIAEGGIENRYYNDPFLSRAVVIRPIK